MEHGTVFCTEPSLAVCGNRCFGGRSIKTKSTIGIGISLFLGYPKGVGNYSFITVHGFQWINGNESLAIGYACKVLPAKNDHRRECPLGTVTGLSDVCYKFAYTQAEYFPSLLACSESGGNLISVHDQRTNDLIADVIVGTSFQSFFLGAVKVLKESALEGWSWEDNSPFDYTNWAANTGSLVFLFLFYLCLSNNEIL